jgi:hypothetical protein
MLHLGMTTLLLTSLGLIIRYTHPPCSLLSTALSSTSHPCSLKSPQYSGNWRSRQASVPRLSHDLWKKQRFSTFVAFNLQNSQFKVISCKATQTLHQIGLYSNKKSYKLHQPHSFTSTIVTPGTNLFQKNPVSTPPSATPVLVIECSRPPPAPNINQPFTPITTFVHKRCTSSFMRKRWKKPPAAAARQRRQKQGGSVGSTVEGLAERRRQCGSGAATLGSAVAALAAQGRW